MTKSPHEALVTDVGKALMANDAESIDHQARAVLRVIYAALLEPTPEMLEAGARAVSEANADDEYQNTADAIFYQMLYASALAPDGDETQGGAVAK